jgi:hypothetical protein
MPLDPEIRVAEPEVADVETFVTAVLTGTNDAEVATAAVGIARAKTPHLRVVPEELRSRVEEPRVEPSTARVPQDPTGARILLQEPKHVVLGLHFFGGPARAPGQRSLEFRCLRRRPERPRRRPLHRFVETLASEAAEDNALIRLRRGARSARRPAPAHRRERNAAGAGIR